MTAFPAPVGAFVGLVASRCSKHDDAARRPAPSDTQDDGNPFVDWLVSDAWKAPSSEALVESLVRRLIEAGIPVSRGGIGPAGRVAK